MRSSASIYRKGGDCERQGLAQGTGWKKFVETPRNWISRRGLFLSGVRNEDKRGDCGIAWSMVIDSSIACPSKLSLARSFARSLARPSRAEIGNLLTRDRHSCC